MKNSVLGSWYTIVSEAYSKIVHGSVYDLDAAQDHHKVLFGQGILAKDIPKAENEHVLSKRYGCCLEYSNALLHELHQAGINAKLAISLEENPVTKERTDSHVSVFIQDDDGNSFIADPVETVKTHGEDMILVLLAEFQKLNGTVWIYDPYGENENLPFMEFMGYPEKTYSVEN